MTLVQMLSSKKSVDENGCWNWTGTKCRGYGRFYIDGKIYITHRASWELKHGALPKELHIDHLCRNKACFNPDHLEPVTKKENTLRGFSRAANNARKKTCKYGHEFTAWRNRRVCYPCAREAQRRHLERKQKTV